MIDRLDGHRFKIDKDTDYVELAASMSILDIAVDNGRSVGIDLTNAEAEREFNTSIDALAARIKAIWSNINDTGASFISRIDAKEAMEGVRYRMIYTVRTRPKSKQSVFDNVRDDDDDAASMDRQAGFMKGYFKRIRTSGNAESKAQNTVVPAC